MVKNVIKKYNVSPHTYKEEIYESIGEALCTNTKHDESFYLNNNTWLPLNRKELQNINILIASKDLEHLSN